MLRIGVEELSWRGRLTRTLEVGPSHLCALDGRGERCSTWPLAELIEIGREADRLWMVVPGLCGACSRKVTYATGSEKECEALVALLRTARQRPGGSGAFVAAMRDAMSAAYVSGLSPQKVIVIEPSLSIETAFQLLLDRNITSAPVIDSNAAVDGRPPFLGFLDLRDLLASAVLSYRETIDANRAAAAHPAQTVASRAAPEPQLVHPCALPRGASCRSGLAACLRDASFLSQSPAYLARRNPIAACRPDASLLDVCALLASGHRRVLLVESDASRARAVLSQSRMAGCILQAWRRLPALRAAAECLKVSDFVPKFRTPIACDVRLPAIDAFETLVRHGISGVALVDEDGRMQAALSAKDLRRVLRSGDVESLSLPALDYLRHNDGPAMDASLLTVTSSSSVFEMFERFVSSGSHRLFVADEGGKLVGVLSLKDALALVIGSVHLELGPASRPAEVTPHTPPRMAAQRVPYTR